MKKLKEIPNMEILENIDVKDCTTFKVSCIARYLVKPKDKEAMVLLFQFLKEMCIRYKVIGKGSNLIFVNKTFDGVLISLDYFDYFKVEGTKVIVGAGYSLMKLSLETAKLGLSGLEFASGIPGSVGGSLVNNAGAYGSDMSKVVTSVKVLMPNYEVKTFTKEELKFCYRSSFLQYKQDYVCLEVEFTLEKGSSEEIRKRMQTRREKRMAAQPLQYPSAGSVFRNPEGMSVWTLIENLGFRGKKVGGAQVSEVHTNFIINTGEATGKDIKELILEIQEAVKKEYNIDLVCEQEFVE